MVEVSRRESHVLPASEKILRALNARCWTSGELARRSGLSTATVSAALRGRPVAARTLLAIVRAFEKSPPEPGAAELLGGGEAA
jgi:transcriptional regulator with XRE-family HTH domain